MKKVFLPVVFLTFVKSTVAQTTIPSGIISFSLPVTHGPVIKGNVQNDWRSVQISAGDGSPNTGCYIQMFPTNTSNYTDGGGHIDLVSVGSTTAGEAFVFTNYEPSSNQYRRLMVARKNGKILMGHDIWASSQFPGVYRLYVQDGILTEKVKVALRTTADWADHVFSQGYKLMKLEDLEKFVREQKRLPGIPSADSMVKNGNDLADTDAMLLEKIEELTLYIIQLNKDKFELEAELKKLKVELDTNRNIGPAQAADTATKAKVEDPAIDLIQLKKELQELRLKVEALLK